MNIKNKRYLTIDLRGNIVAFYNKPTLQGIHYMDLIDDDDDLRSNLVEECDSKVLTEPKCIRIDEIFYPADKCEKHDALYMTPRKSHNPVGWLLSGLLIGMLLCSII